MSISEALTELGIKEWVLRGEPTTEAEFGQMFRKVTGADSNGSAIESSKPSDWGTTWSAVKAKADELKAAEPMKLLRAEDARRGGVGPLKSLNTDLPGTTLDIRHSSRATRARWRICFSYDFIWFSFDSILFFK